MLRIYLSKVIGDGQTPATAYRAAWRGVIGDVDSHGVIDADRHGFWIGQIDTTDAQHAALLAASDVRHINHAALDLTFAQLTADQRTKAAEVLTWLGIDVRAVLDVFTTAATVRDLLTWLIGKARWHTLKDF